MLFSFWNKVKNRLAELTTKGKSTPLLLKNFQETIIEDILSNSTSDELTLKDIEENEVRNERYTSLSIEQEMVVTYYEKSELQSDFRTATDIVKELYPLGLKIRIENEFLKYHIEKILLIFKVKHFLIPEIEFY
mgnify:CR=1 FL=1